MFDSFFSTKYSELDVYVLTSKPVTKFYEECSAFADLFNFRREIRFVAYLCPD